MPECPRFTIDGKVIHVSRPGDFIFFGLYTAHPVSMKRPAIALQKGAATAGQKSERA